ncbi:MAG: hypothetical protein B6I17_00840 [Tenericutes bacterium 4572_104]|nr:MAG: hypothetical protein B6I17_00840 [Tenericutes bacterium 4572_104]
MDIPILFEDNHILVCVKPQGVLSQGGSIDKPNMVDELKKYIKEKYNKPGNVYLGLVHRLDINVGGVMVFAKTSKAAKRLSKQVKDHDIKKRYLAIAKGTFEKKRDRYVDYLSKNEEKRQAIIAEEISGKLAILNYQVLGQTKLNEDIYSLIDIDLITGRFHQIRFQFSYHGHPLYGDSKYGNMINKDFFLGLYAYSLEFTHPVKKEKMIFKNKPNDERFLKFSKINKIDWREI